MQAFWSLPLLAEERRRPLIGELRRLLRSAIAHFSREAVILAGIIMQRHLGMIVQSFVHLLLRRLVDEAVLEALLGVIPSATARCHGNGYEEAVDDDAEE